MAAEDDKGERGEYRGLELSNTISRRAEDTSSALA